MSDINLNGELKKGYLMFRAFENALKLSDKLDGLEQTIALREKSLADVEEKIKSSNNFLDVEKKKIEGQIISLSEDAAFKKRQIEKDFADFKKTFDDKYKPLTDKLSKIEAKISVAESEYNDLCAKLDEKKNSFDLLNKEIEETKAKFRGIL